MHAQSWATQRIGSIEENDIIMLETIQEYTMLTLYDDESTGGQRHGEGGKRSTLHELEDKRLVIIDHV
jgi:hypothetical protein